MKHVWNVFFQGVPIMFVSFCITSVILVIPCVHISIIVHLIQKSGNPNPLRPSEEGLQRLPKERCWVEVKCCYFKTLKMCTFLTSYNTSLLKMEEPWRTASTSYISNSSERSKWKNRLLQHLLFKTGSSSLTHLRTANPPLALRKQLRGQKYKASRWESQIPWFIPFIAIDPSQAMPYLLGTETEKLAIRPQNIAIDNHGISQEVSIFLWPKSPYKNCIFLKIQVKSEGLIDSNQGFLPLGHLCWHLHG